MIIPDSVLALTEEVPADPFLAVKKTDLPNIDQIAHEIKRGLEFKDLQAFEQGYSFYKKDLSSERVFIKNLLALFADYITRSIRTSNLEDIRKDEAISSMVSTLKGIELLWESNYTLLNILNKDQNILDAKALLLIILGYATSCTKRIYHN